MFAPIAQRATGARRKNNESFRLADVLARRSRCASIHCDHTDHMRSARYFKQDWETLYRAAVSRV